MGSAKGWSIMNKIRRLKQLDWEVRLEHIYREANRCADILANFWDVILIDVFICFMNRLGGDT
ncbi:hypothetical protein A2U01_0050601, partial [Trifolium medium]|nr:hypothetical protein [Trifolium medium]